MKYSKLIIYTLISLLIIDSYRYISWVEDLNVGYSTYVSSFLQYSSIIIFAFVPIRTKSYKNIPKPLLNLYYIWIGWLLFNIIRGAFLADNYWDWKFLLLTSLTFTLIALVYFIGSHLIYAKKIIRFTLKHLFVFGFLFIPLTFVTNEQLYSRLMIPISLFIVFIPYLKPKWRMLVIIVAITSILMSISFRSNILKIVFSVLLLSIYYFRILMRPIWIKIAHKLLFIVPIILMVLAAAGNFNILSEIKKNEDYTITNSKDKEQNLLDDTRTFLYVEVFNSIKESGNWVLGESASGSYKSIWFYDTGGAMNGRRYRTEVNILNVFLYHGIIGVVLYFLLLYKISYYAIYKSNNQLSKMLGLFIAFRWTMGFIEEFTQYDLNFYFFWLTMGLISNTKFRNLTDKQLKKFFRFNEKKSSRTPYLS